MRMTKVAATVCAAAAALSGAVDASRGPCETPATLMAVFNYTHPGTGCAYRLAACEDFSTRNGAITFTAVDTTPNEASPCNPWSALTLTKHVASNTPIDGNDNVYAVPGVFNFTKADVIKAASDIMGNALLGVHGHPARETEPTLSEVASAVPPLRGIAGARVWVASRGSGVDCTFDENGVNHVQGTPSPDMVAGVLPGAGRGWANATGFDHEGVIDELPVLVLNFPVAKGNGSGPDVVLWEMVVVPVPNDTGYEQPVFVRFAALNRSARESNSAPRTLHFDTFAYVPSMCSSDTLAGCGAPGDFFGAMLDNHLFWAATWAREGKMTWAAVPGGVASAGGGGGGGGGGTDGGLLVRHAEHALVLDMITRNGNVWPRYGTYPGYEQPGVGADGFQEIFTATMAASLEWGLFEYATKVLDNWLTYFVGKKGFVLYRGLEMAQQGRMLTMAAMHYFYTRDPSLLVKHVDKIAGIGWMLLDRRRRALAAFPNRTDARHGMPTGNDEADLWWATVEGHPDTEMPFISVAAEAWRGLRDCGEALLQVALIDPTQAKARAIGANFTAEAPPLLADLRRSVALDARPATNGTVCHPYVAGYPGCGELAGEPSPRDSEPWRTYAEALYSGALDAGTVREILEWHQVSTGGGIRGSALKLGVLSGCGGDVSCGDSLETFTVHGWGSGLLQADLVEPFLLQWFALVSHAYTRGTFIAPESTPVDRARASPSFATPAGLTSPLLLKWAVVFEDPATRALWVGKAVPRAWLAEGEAVDVRGVPTAHGRLSVRFESSVASAGLVRVNVSAPQWATPAATASRSVGVSTDTSRMQPSGDAHGQASSRYAVPASLVIRVRAPGRATLTRVTVGGRPWAGFNASCECVTVPGDRIPALARDLETVVAYFG